MRDGVVETFRAERGRSNTAPRAAGFALVKVRAETTGETEREGETAPPSHVNALR